MPFIGELAALATSIFFSIGPTFFTLAGRLVGSALVNRTRLVVALVYLLVTHWILYGTPLPLDANPDRWFWLGLSGLIGFVLGDAALFQAFIQIGTRLTMLIFATNPIVAAILAWIFLGESLTLTQIIGMLITLAGIGWVMLEQNNPEQEISERKVYASGILLALPRRRWAGGWRSHRQDGPLRRFSCPLRPDHAGQHRHRISSGSSLHQGSAKAPSPPSKKSPKPSSTS